MPADYDLENSGLSGFCKSVVVSKEFSSRELEILRAFEWDRINFSTPKRREVIARMNGITVEEVEEWRVKTRRSIGVNVLASKQE